MSDHERLTLSEWGQDASQRPLSPSHQAPSKQPEPTHGPSDGPARINNCPTTLIVEPCLFLVLPRTGIVGPVSRESTSPNRSFCHHQPTQVALTWPVFRGSQCTFVLGKSLDNLKCGDQETGVHTACDAARGAWLQSNICRQESSNPSRSSPIPKPQCRSYRCDLTWPN